VQQAQLCIGVQAIDMKMPGDRPPGISNSTGIHFNQSQRSSSAKSLFVLAIQAGSFASSLFFYLMRKYFHPRWNKVFCHLFTLVRRRTMPLLESEKSNR
jgi:hypothetical protein